MRKILFGSIFLLFSLNSMANPTAPPEMLQGYCSLFMVVQQNIVSMVVQQRYINFTALALSADALGLNSIDIQQMKNTMQQHPSLAHQLASMTAKDYQAEIQACMQSPQQYLPIVSKAYKILSNLS